MEITVTAPDCFQLPQALEREWLIVNGCGGYASGTVSGCHTRKHHGLLAANLEFPPGVFVLLSQIEDWLETDGDRWDLAVHEYPEVFFPKGHLNLVRFELRPCPAFHYACGDIAVTRRFLMIHRENTLLVRYDLDGGPEAGSTLCVRPQFAYRDANGITRANGECRLEADRTRNGFHIEPYPGMPGLYAVSNLRNSWQAEPTWFYNVRYRRDAARGFEHEEDLFSPGVLRFRLRPGRTLLIAFTTEAKPPAPTRLKALWTREIERAGSRLPPRRKQPAPAADSPAASLAARAEQLFAALEPAAEQFLVHLPGAGPAVHAGYHWFGPWGRDSLIALPGLAFIRNRLDFGRQILQRWARLEWRGLLPNFINPDGTPAYTAADPALWFFWSVQQYLEAGGELETVERHFWPAMRSILEHYRRGTENQISAASSTGLLRCGLPGMATTWMDSQIGGRPVVPRWGYVVEINALWYNAVCFGIELAGRLNQPLPGLDPAFRERLKEAFVRTFWIEDLAILLDTANEFYQDVTVRPNQIFAVSLPYSPLTDEQQKSVVETVREELFTPRGLRTLTPNDLRYRPLCLGDHWVRELAYHQGAVRPWLLAHFADAWFRTHGENPAETRALFQPVLESFAEHVRSEAGLGTISEIFDGDPPYTPRGAIAQAWNVGELLRLLDRLRRLPD